MLTLVLAESALEKIPTPLLKHPSVVKQAQRKRKNVRELLLDRSYHHAAMKDLENSWKRARPDIIHLSLLAALGTPLNKERFLKTYIHTLDDHVITVNPEIRLPRSYMQFVGLIEQLFNKGKVPQQGPILLKLTKKTLFNLISELKTDYVVALTRIGKPKTIKEVANILVNHQSPVVIVGAFPHGHFSKRVTKIANETISVDPNTLEAWIVISRVLYEYEQAISLSKKRLCFEER